MLFRYIPPEKRYEQDEASVGREGQGLNVKETVQTWAYALGTLCTRSNSVLVWVLRKLLPWTAFCR